MKKVVLGAISLLAFLGILTGVGYYLTHNVDWIRVAYKRFKAEDSYVFDEISPRLERTDPAKLIRVESPQSAALIREALTRSIWGTAQLPLSKMPERDSEDPPEKLRGIPGVTALQTWRIPIDFNYTAFVFILQPENPNGRLVIYQHGYAGTAEDMMAPLFERLITQGYTIAASNYPDYGRNRLRDQNLERFGWFSLSHDRLLSVHPQPMRFYIEPVIVLLNAFRDQYERVDLVGFSAGGWVATVAAAVDRRVARTITVAGGYPLYLRLKNFAREAPPPQLYPPLLMAANYLEMYVLAAAGESRSLTQIFNKYDRCCYRNSYGRLYEPAVRQAAEKIGTGGFQVLIDETHADHKVSEWAIGRILKGLAAAP